jgi:ADP-ribose pyrophosphatase YjhB (NUDIX family)
VFIDAELYSQIIQKIPIVCVDVLLRVDGEGYFLVQRASDPLKNEWWVVGGRKHLGEDLKEAANRILHQEIGDVASFIEIEERPVGVYLDAFEKSSFSSHLYETVSLLVVGYINRKDLNSIALDKSILGWKVAPDLPARLNNKSFWLYPQSI